MCAFKVKLQIRMKKIADLVNKVSQIRVDEYESLISIDVSVLFTSVPVEESIKLIHEKLTADPSLADRTVISPQQVTDLLRTCLTTIYFKYNGTFNAQIEGASMGSRVSPLWPICLWRIMRVTRWKHTRTHPNIGACTLMTPSQ